MTSIARDRRKDYAPFVVIPVEKLLEEVLALPADARAMLADRLVESLDPLNDDSVREAWANEALRRRDEVRSGKVKTVSAQQVADELDELLRDAD